jgi:hypothetical protein
MPFYSDYSEGNPDRILLRAKAEKKIEKGIVRNSGKSVYNEQETRNSRES